MFKTLEINEEYFSERVNKIQLSDIDGKCWEWKGARNYGYGQLKYKYKTYRAHRFTYMYFKGEIGELNVLHKCDNPCCINPEHLFLGTHKDNVSDKVLKGRQARSMLGKFGKEHNRSKKVSQYTLDGKFINTFGGVRDASRITGITSSGISLCCRGNRKKSGGYIWEYN